MLDHASRSACDCHALSAAHLDGGVAAAPASAQLRVTVVGEEYVPMRIAVPDFDSSGTGAARSPRRSSEVLRADLASSAVFQLVDKAAFIERDRRISTWRRAIPDWQVAGVTAQALVVGNVVVNRRPTTT